METKELHPKGVENLMCALVDSARSRYVKRIAGWAKADKVSVKTWYDLHKNAIYHWEEVVFVRNDPYGIFGDFDADGILKAWNALAQDYIGGTNKGSKGNTFKTS